jgi:hypothetical protein
MHRQGRSRPSHASRRTLPRQEQLLKLLQDYGGLTPAEQWTALGISKLGAMDLLHPLLEGWARGEARWEKEGELCLEAGTTGFPSGGNLAVNGSNDYFQHTEPPQIENLS